jgi:hypothetical protein
VTKDVSELTLIDILDMFSGILNVENLFKITIVLGVLEATLTTEHIKEPFGSVISSSRLLNHKERTMIKDALWPDTKVYPQISVFYAPSDFSGYLRAYYK